MNVIAFEINKGNKKAIITVSADDPCFVKEVRDDILKSDMAYIQGNLIRFTEPKNWLPKDCD